MNGGNHQITIENLVASTSLGVELDLERIAVVSDEIEYEPEQFPGLVLHLEEPKIAALIFGSGKIVVTGAKSIDDVEMAVAIIIEMIESAGIKVPENPKIELQNIVASTNLNAELNLDAIAIGLDRTEYEPEQFPGLVYRLEDPKVVILLFGSGKVVCTGAKNPEDVELAVDIISEKLTNLGLL
jgi:transcription initiation factor TFIID TATA-box-binding protein